MSIYVNLRSSECKDIYSKNHGGNFKIELNEPLRLQGPWEVALAEMTYHAHAFPNLPHEHSAVQVTLKEQLQVYETRDQDFSIRTWVLYGDIWVCSDHFDIARESRFPHIIMLPKKNYDWQDFKEAMECIGKKQLERNQTPTPVTNLTFTFTEHALVCKIGSFLRTCFTFSPDLGKFLSLPKMDVFQAPGINVYAEEVAYVKPLLPQEKFIIWSEDLTTELWVKIDDVKIDIPKTSNTMEKFTSFMLNLTKGTVYEKLVSFEFRYEDKAKEYLYYVGYKCTEACKPMKLEWSKGIYGIAELRDKVLTYEYSKGEYARLHTGTIFKLPPSAAPLATISENLGYNFYPTAKSMIDALNNIIWKCSSILNSKPIDKSLFGLDDNGMCTLIEDSKFSVTLSIYLMQLLQLTNTSTTQTGRAFFIMPTATREFLYVHTDMLDSHSYNSETNVLRVINNDRAVNEKVMISFPNLYYYPISARYLSNIQIRITDNHSDEDLPFALEVTCLLHFRRCNKPPFL